MCRIDWKGVAGGRKPAKEMGGDEVLTWWLGWIQGRFELSDPLDVWDEERGASEDWLAWVTRLVVVPSLRWEPGRGVGSGRVSSSWTIVSELLESRVYDCLVHHSASGLGAHQV